jgi:CheY-like chemotaxis protein
MAVEHRPAVLIIDDEPSIREAVRDCLEDEHYLVYEAADGRPALALMRGSADPLVILLDWRMPEMDGLAVLQALVVEGPSAWRHAYILFSAGPIPKEVSTLNLPSDIFLEALSKPFELDDLLDLVARACVYLEEGTR